MEAISQRLFWLATYSNNQLIMIPHAFDSIVPYSVSPQFQEKYFFYNYKPNIWYWDLCSKLMLSAEISTEQTTAVTWTLLFKLIDRLICSS